MLTIGVPSGIGDVSWMYSKLMHAEPMRWEIAAGWPHRTRPFMELLPKVVEVDYGDFQYQDISIFWNIHKQRTWKDVEAIGAGKLLIEANSWLEQGKRIEDWMPDLPTDFHYEIKTTKKDQDRASLLLKDFKRPLWGVSAASYRGSEAWKTWGLDEWLDFLGRFNIDYGGTIILLGGFWDDLTSSLASAGYKDLVGKTSIGCAIEVLKELEGYIGFSSGLGVLRTVLNKRVFMLWPEHQQPLSTSWAPPKMIEDGTYVAMPWRSPREIFARTKVWLKNGTNL